ncbi:MAG: DUF4468 domain-containing protein [Bacteroidales bacterium]|nr:DUF4468 domain-containing protein [Bacteroidales bacterium]
MKKLLCVSLIAFSFMSVNQVFAQETANSHNLPIDPDSQKILYQDVVEENGDPGYLYNKAMEWFNFYYLSPTSIFSIQDRVNGKIEGNGRMPIYFKDEQGNTLNAGVIGYTIRVEFKDNRYRYTLTDFTLKGASRSPIEKWLNKQDPAYNPKWDVYLYQVDTAMQRLTSTLIEKMKPTEVKTDEW